MNSKLLMKKLKTQINIISFGYLDYKIAYIDETVAKA